MSEEANYSGDEMQEAAAPTADSGQDVSTEQVTEQPNEQVPLSALQSERAQRQQLAEELQMMKEHISLLQSSQQQSQPKRQDPLDGLPDDDIPTMGDIKKLFREREKQYQASLTEMQMAQRHPDYSEVISKYLPEVIKQNPSFKTKLQETQDYELAYYLAKNSEGYRSAHKKSQKNADAAKVVQNSQMAGSLSSMGTTSPINTAKRYRDMSDDDFRREMNKNLGYA